MYRTYGGLIAERRFEPAGFAAPLGHKDIRLTLAAAEALRVPMPFASVLHDRFLTLLAHGGEALDWSAIGGSPRADSGRSARYDARSRAPVATAALPLGRLARPPRAGQPQSASAMAHRARRAGESAAVQQPVARRG